MTWLLWTALALAADVTICVDADVDYDDADGNGTEDYFKNSGLKALRGVRVVLTENFGANNDIESYAEWENNAASGLEPGCAAFTGISVATGDTYDVAVESSFSVRSSTLEVRNSGGQQNMLFESAASAVQFSADDELDYDVGPHRVWDVGAAAAHAIQRRDGGITMTPTFYVTDSQGTLHVPASCSGPCIVGEDIYISDAHAAKKFAIVKHLGTVLLYDLAGGTPVMDHSASGASWGGSQTTLISAEHWSSAAGRGFAYFYAATAFNKTQEADCSFAHWMDLDFDGMGPPCFDTYDTLAGRHFSCAVGRAPLTPPANQLAYWSTNSQSSIGIPAGTALDVVRLFWELQSSGEVNFTEIVDLYAATSPATWTVPSTANFTAAWGSEGHDMAVWNAAKEKHLDD